jgi:hypothetical protein
MSELETIVTSVFIVQKGEPIFAEGATRVEICDEGAGEFVVVSQPSETKTGIAFDPEHWPIIRAAIDDMVGRCRS